jgi:hypothetical protein
MPTFRTSQPDAVVVVGSRRFRFSGETLEVSASQATLVRHAARLRPELGIEEVAETAQELEQAPTPSTRRSRAKKAGYNPPQETASDIQDGESAAGAAEGDIEDDGEGATEGDISSTDGDGQEPENE